MDYRESKEHAPGPKIDSGIIEQRKRELVLKGFQVKDGFFQKGSNCVTFIEIEYLSVEDWSENIKQKIN